VQRDLGSPGRRRVVGGVSVVNVFPGRRIELAEMTYAVLFATFDEGRSMTGVTSRAGASSGQLARQPPQADKQERARKQEEQQ
jgi:hypothetical protein